MVQSEKDVWESSIEAGIIIFFFNFTKKIFFFILLLSELSFVSFISN